MTLAQAVTQALPTLRAEAEAMMVDTGVLEERTGRTFNAQTGQYDDTWEVVYEGPVKVRPRPSEGLDRQVGETEIRTLDYLLAFPVPTPVAAGQRFRCLTSTYDPLLVDKPMRIVDVLVSSWPVQRKAVAERIEGEEADGDTS